MTDSDPRFTIGVIYDVAKVLEEHGYPKLEKADFVELQQALFAFLYRSKYEPGEPS